MRIPALGREYLRLKIETSPQLTTWEASFDGGDTWYEGEPDDEENVYRWLVAGVDVDPGGAVLVVDRRYPVLVRATDEPEILVRQAGSVAPA